MTDSWDLKKLFSFDSEYLKIYNDTEEDIEYVDPKKQKVIIKRKGIGIFREKNQDYNIPNKDTLLFSNKSVHEIATFDENLLWITHLYRNQIKEGQIIKGIDFLGYHYNWASKNKKKKEFISFVKYYFLSKYWLPKEKREKDWIIDEWIKEREVENERPKYFWLLGLIISFLILGVIFLSEYRQLMIGSTLGVILGQTNKLIDKINSKN